MQTTPDLYHYVALSRDFPEHQLKQGDVALLIDYVPHPQGGEAGCVLEVFNAAGDSIAVIAVPLSAIEEMSPNAVLSVRPLVESQS
jgi:hypothetical protein